VAMTEVGAERVAFGSYDDYLSAGGLFTEEDFDKICSLDGVERVPLKSIETNLIKGIASCCSIDISPRQIIAFNLLRTKMPPTDGIARGIGAPQTMGRGDFVRSHHKESPDARDVWKMSDQELVRQVVLATEGTGSKYKAITDRYPNIFGSNGNGKK
jgi:hypothetical protein